MSTAETKSVTLGGVSYDVPPVPFNVCAKIIPLVDKTFNALRANKLDEESILSLGSIVYLGIAKPPALTEEIFLSYAVPLAEMIAAAVAVAQQANMKAQSPGEAAAGTAPQIPSTSTN
jgi:hypothetical protein